MLCTLSTLALALLAGQVPAAASAEVPTARDRALWLGQSAGGETASMGTPATANSERGPSPAVDLLVRPRLVVRAGWARLNSGGSVVRITPESRTRELEGPCYLELGAQSRADLVWPSGAQAQLAGTTGLELRALDEQGLAWSWQFRRLAEVELDIRRGAHTLHLPRAQVLLPRRGMFRLDGSVGGSVRMEHRAGQSIELDVGGRYTFELPVGLRRLLPERLTSEPASYRSTR